MSAHRVVQRGFKKKQDVLPIMRASYLSALVQWMRDHDYTLEVGKTRFYLTAAFGFCYGVDRAVQYAYETRLQFPDRKIFLSGEIIHNPYVNRQLESVGISMIPVDSQGHKVYSGLRSDDIIIIPAFGITREERAILQKCGCLLVDTTCGSVLNVWKNVRQYARDGYTAIMHGKVHHEETRATVSQAVKHGGHFIIVHNFKESRVLVRFILGTLSSQALLDRFETAVSPHFDPDRDLKRIGFANQTTMLMNESIRIQNELRDAMVKRYGRENLDEHFRAIDTICSATQERQDAVQRLLADQDIHLMVVIGGFNSSNTGSLLDICSVSVPSYHVESHAGLIDRDRIRHKPFMKPPTVTTGWLSPGPLNIGVTAGASTPDNIVANVILRVVELRNEDFSRSRCYEDLRAMGLTGDIRG